MAWLACSGLPAHDVVRVGDHVVLIRQHGAEILDAVFLAVIPPRLDRVGSDAHELDAERLKVLALLQVDHLQDASASARPHAEVEKSRLVVREVGECHLITTR